MKHKLKQRLSMRFHVWGWFMIFVIMVFVLLWIFQIIFLQKFYDRMKKNDVLSAAEEMVALYESGNYRDQFRQLAYENNMCIEVRDALERHVWEEDVLGGSCLIHGLNNYCKQIIRRVQQQPNGIYYGTETLLHTNVKMFIYACRLGSPDAPQGYLLLNSPLLPVNSTVNILKRQTIMITVIMILIAFCISVIVSKRLSKPIMEVTKEAEQLAHGKYDIVFQGGGYNEVDRLAETLTYASHEINRVDTMQRDLIANTSHDLRTPLTMLKAYAEMIRDISGNNPVKREQHLQVIIDETDRLTALVNDILDLSKLENGKMLLERSEFDMEQKLHEILDRYRGLSTVSGYTFQLETDQPAKVNCDPVKIERVICNLINNAMNYSGEDKQIFIKAEHLPDGLKISVRDTGEGMDQETVSRIFDKYYRSENYKRAVVGTGLGLSIVKAILRLHNYAFGVDSQVGVGSTFWFIVHKDDIVKENGKDKDKKESKKMPPDA